MADAFSRWVNSTLCLCFAALDILKSLSTGDVFCTCVPCLGFVFGTSATRHSCLRRVSLESFGAHLEQHSADGINALSPLPCGGFTLESRTSRSKSLEGGEAGDCHQH